MPAVRPDCSTRSVVHDCPCPVGMACDSKAVAIYASDQVPAIRRMTASASSEVRLRLRCSPGFGFRPRTSECCPPRQWMIRMTSRDWSSTSTRISSTSVRTSCCLTRVSSVGVAPFCGSGGSLFASLPPGRWRLSPFRRQTGSLAAKSWLSPFCGRWHPLQHRDAVGNDQWAEAAQPTGRIANC